MASKTRYLLIDQGGVLETYKENPTENDLILKEFSGVYQVLEDGVSVIQTLNELEKYNFLLAFHSKTKKDDQLVLYKSLISASTKKNLKFPEFVAMAVYSSQAYTDHQCDNPQLETNTDPKITIAGYCNELEGKACVRKALQKALAIKDSERNLHYVFDDGRGNIETAQKEGWQTYLIDQNMTLENAINQILEKYRQNPIIPEIKEDPLFFHEYLIKLYRKTAIHELFQSEILKNSKHFKLTVKPRPDSECFSAGVFRELVLRKDQSRRLEPNEQVNAEWLGECRDPDDEEFLEVFAYKQKVAADLYGCFAGNAVKMEISTQKICHVDDADEFNPRTFVMSELLPNFQTYKEFCGRNFTLTNPNPNGYISSKTNEKVQEQCLGQILAVAFFINDFDPFGQAGENIGIIMEKFFAKTYKFRYVSAFEKVITPEKPRTIRVGRKIDQVVEFDKLSHRTKEEFLMVAQKIIALEKPALTKFFTRKAVEVFGAYYDTDAELLTNMLLERQSTLKKYYEQDLKSLDKYKDRFAPPTNY